MGIFNKIRGGADSNHRTGRMDYPYAGDGSPAPQNEPRSKHELPSDLYTHRITDGNFSKETMSPQSGAASAPSGRGKYLIHGSAGGGYVTTTPSQGKEDRHDVTYWSNDNKEQYSVSGARFKHDADEGTASFYGGTEQGSGRQMGHMWSKPTWGGNIHQDQ